MRRSADVTWTLVVWLIHLLSLTRRPCYACSPHEACLNDTCWVLLRGCYKSRDQARQSCQTDYADLASHLDAASMQFLAAFSKALTGWDNTYWIDGDVTSTAMKTAVWSDGTPFTFDRVTYNGTCVRLSANDASPFIDTNKCDTYHQTVCAKTPPPTSPAVTTSAASTTVVTTTANTTTTSIVNTTAGSATTSEEPSTSATQQQVTSGGTTTPGGIVNTTAGSATTSEEPSTSATQQQVTSGGTTTPGGTTAPGNATSANASSPDATTEMRTTPTTSPATDEYLTTADGSISPGATTGEVQTSGNSITMATTGTPHNATSGSNSSTPVTTPLCFCRCAPRRDVLSINLTDLPLSQFVPSKRNKGETMPDNRPSAIAIGSLGIAILITVAALIILPDLPRVFSDIRHAFHHCCSHDNDLDPDPEPDRKRKRIQ